MAKVLNWLPDAKLPLTPEEAKRSMETALRAAMDRPLFTGTAVGLCGGTFALISHRLRSGLKRLFTPISLLQMPVTAVSSHLTEANSCSLLEQPAKTQKYAEHHA